MPPVPVPNDLSGTIANLANRLRAVESQQNQTLTDALGRPLVNIGLAPASSPAQYGVQLVAPATGAQLAMFGTQADGTVSLTFYDAAGNVVSKLDAAGFHAYNAGREVTRIDSTGQHSYDAGGNELTRVDTAGLHAYNAGTEVTRIDTAGLHAYNAGTEVTRIDTAGLHAYNGGTEVTRIDTGGLHAYNAGAEVTRIDTAGLHSYSGAAEVTRIDGAGLHAFDGAAHELTRVDTAGLHTYNTAGTEEVRAGLINASPAIYGLGVLPYGGGTLQQVAGILSASPGDVLNITNTTYVNMPSPSAVTVQVGAAGTVLLQMRSYISTNAGSVYGFAGVSIDGGAVQDQLIFGTGGGNGGATVSTTRVLGGLAAGTHTFQAAAKMSGPGTASLQGTFLTITPQ